MPDLLDQALDRVVTQTGALAGIVTVHTPGGDPLTIHRPAALAPGLTWLDPILDEALEPGLEAPRYTVRTGVDTGVLDLPLIRGTGRDRAPASRLPPPGGAGHLPGCARRHRRRDRGCGPAGPDARGPAPTRAGARGPVRGRAPAHRSRRSARHARHDHRPRARAAGRRTRGRLPVRRRRERHPARARERMAMADDGSVCLVARTRRWPPTSAQPAVPAAHHRPRSRPRLGRASAAWPGRPARRAVRGPPGQAVHRGGAQPARRPGGHGRDRRPHRPPPRGRGAVDDPRRA